MGAMQNSDINTPSCSLYYEVDYRGSSPKSPLLDIIYLCSCSGFDDDNGSYIKVLHDHIAYRYEIREVIGKGSFGQVVKVSGCVKVPPYMK